MLYFVVIVLSIHLSSCYMLALSQYISFMCWSLMFVVLVALQFCECMPHPFPFVSFDFSSYHGLFCDPPLFFNIIPVHKIKTWKSMIHKLAATSWNAKRKTLRMSDLALVLQNTVLWDKSKHNHKLYILLNNARRTVLKILKLTTITWILTDSSIKEYCSTRTAQATGSIGLVEYNQWYECCWFVHTQIQ